MITASIETIQLAGRACAAAYQDWHGLPIEFQPLTRLYTSDLTATGPEPALFGFVALASDTLIVATRGTESIWEWWADAQLTRVVPRYTKVGTVASGFESFYADLRTTREVNGQRAVDYIAATRPKNLLITGHSLGAALATLLALELSINGIMSEVVTFGSPEIGDPAFAQHYDTLVPGTTRVANRYDLIPLLPGKLFGYQHVSGPYSVQQWGGLGGPACWHVIQSYQNALDPAVPLSNACQVGWLDSRHPRNVISEEFADQLIAIALDPDPRTGVVD